MGAIDTEDTEAIDMNDGDDVRSIDVCVSIHVVAELVKMFR